MCVYSIFNNVKKLGVLRSTKWAEEVKHSTQAQNKCLQVRVTRQHEDNMLGIPIHFVRFAWHQIIN